MDIQPTDIAILLVSAAACIYCFVLNRRLRALQNTNDGLGASIVAFSKSVSDMSQSTAQTRSTAGQIAARLTELLKEAHETSNRLQSLSRDLGAEHAGLMDKATVEANQVCERIQSLTSDLEIHAANRFDAVIANGDSEFARIKEQFESLISGNGNRLDSALHDVEALCNRMESSAADVEQRHESTLTAVKTAQTEFDEEMRTVFAECAQQVAEMETLAVQMRSLTDRTKFSIEEALQRTAKSMLLTPHDNRVDS